MIQIEADDFFSSSFQFGSSPRKMITLKALRLLIISQFDSNVLSVG